MSGLGGLLEELDGHVSRLREGWSHLVHWQSFERGAAVVTELERELSAVGLPVAPVEAVTQGLIAAAEALHSHLTGGAATQEDDIRAQIAALQAKLPASAPEPDPEDPLTKNSGATGG